MRKRVVSWSLIALVILSFATFGTARARQMASVNAAQHRLTVAEHNTARSLAAAARHGMTAAELAPFRRQEARLAKLSRPQPMPLWDPTGASFYDRKSATYGRLTRRLAAREAQLTAGARVLATSSLDGLAREIAAAGAIELPATDAQGALTRERTAFSSAATLGAYRTVAAGADAARGGLHTKVQARTDQLNAVVAKAGGTLAGVTALADAETQSARDRLGLLGLLTDRVNGYGSQLTALNAAVHAQKSAFDAALKEGPLAAEVATIAADYARTIPAKMVVVSTETQHADMYEGSHIVYSTDVTTGGPELPTDHGVFHIYMKASPFVFHSPWPPGSPYYYNPTPVQYWMPFDGAEGLHDASWRSNFGPGSNFAPTDLGTGNTILGTHGCVNLPFAAAQFVWDWAPIGTTVVVI